MHCIKNMFKCMCNLNRLTCYTPKSGKHKRGCEYTHYVGWRVQDRVENLKTWNPRLSWKERCKPGRILEHLMLGEDLSVFEGVWRIGVKKMVENRLYL